jgi:hypothetical protein
MKPDRTGHMENYQHIDLKIIDRKARKFAGARISGDN